MNLLYPKIRPGTILFLVHCALLGTLFAGAYGIVHDQITWTLSNEYFTGFKFHQFDDADPRGRFAPESPAGDRLFVAVIGFLATWWVGFFTGWFLARASVRPDSTHPATRQIMAHFTIVIVCAALFGIAGFLWGTWRPGFGGIYSDDFARVGHIHNFGYLGALTGLIIAIVRVRRERRLAMAKS